MDSVQVPRKMRAARLVGERDYRIIEVETPFPNDHQVLVAITHVGICGSDSSFWKLSHTLNDLHPLPAPPGSHGHEAVGRVVRAGRKVLGTCAGDQVVRINLVADRDWDMRCFAEYALADRPIVVNRGDPRAVCFADPLAVAMIHVQALFHPSLVTMPGLQQPVDLESVAVPKIYRRAEPLPVLIRGLGFIGTLASLLLLRQGLCPVGLELEKPKIEAARGLGIDCRDGRDPDAVSAIVRQYGPMSGALECCGASDVDSLVEALADQGVCVLMGTSRKRIEATYQPLRAKGITIVCPSNAALQSVAGFNYWEPAARLLESGAIAPQSMIDAEYPLACLQQAMEDLERHPEWRRALIRMAG
jgi:threonine dehydrogenase-like Zn-dependent dehydrogenase